MTCKCGGNDVVTHIYPNVVPCHYWHDCGNEWTAPLEDTPKQASLVDKPASEATLREHYAGTFMATLLSEQGDTLAEMAEYAIRAADALIARLEEEK